jgi:hypothetical protein
MRRPRSSVYPSAGLALLFAGILVSACRKSPDPGAGPPSQTPPVVTEENDSDQPIRLVYVCGNKFLITNAYSVAVSVAWR